MNALPQDKNLSVGNLVSTLRNVTNSYKYYWFLSILNIIGEPENEGTSIEINKILARMVAYTWFPVNYFKISFGKLDQLANVVSELLQKTELNEANTFKEVINYIEGIVFSEKTVFNEEKAKIQKLANYVPYRFLSSWFSNEIRNVDEKEKHSCIIKYAEENFHKQIYPPIYKFSQDRKRIILHDEWFAYLFINMEIIRGFTLWNLLKYLQKNNPEVPNLSEKLFEPQKRDLRMAMNFWSLAFEHEESIRCIYSDQLIPIREITIDHFLPWSFTCHDLLWNLVPTSRSVNSSKSDKLPELDLYLTKMTRLQFNAVQIVLKSSNTAKEKLMLDYVNLFKFSDRNQLASCTYENFHARLESSIRPQYAVAQSMGFSENWRWQD